MQELVCNLRILRLIFLKGAWLKISAFYCFVGLFIASASRWVYMEEAVAESLSAYVLTVSVVPAGLLLYYPILHSSRNSAVVTAVGRNNYFVRIRKLLWFVNLIFVVYYGVGTYFLSRYIFTEGSWYDSGANLKIWGLKLLILFLWLMILSMICCILMARNVNFAATAFSVLVLTFLFWRKIDLNGMRMVDFTVLLAVLLAVFAAEEYLRRRADFIYWR